MSVIAESWTEWYVGIPAEVRDLAIGFPIVSLVGIVASAFVLGGFWALRGRAALRFPACRRCQSLLHGSANNVPERCSECGASLTLRRSVLWLRFRRQTLTLLITAPVVMFGGLTLSTALVGGIMTSIDRETRRAQEAIERTARSTTSIGGTGSGGNVLGASVGQGATAKDLRVFASMREVVAQCWEGGEKGMEALLTLAAVGDGTAVSIDESDADRDAALLAFLRDLVAGRRPAAPFIEPRADSPWRSVLRNSSLGGRDGWRSVAGGLLSVLAISQANAALRTEPAEIDPAEIDPVEIDRAELGRLAEALLPDVEIAMPREVTSGSYVVVRAMATARRGIGDARVTEIAIDDKVVWPPEGQAGMQKEDAGLEAPETPGTYRVRVTYRSSIPADARGASLTTVHDDLAQRDGVWTGDLRVTADVDRLTPEGLRGRRAEDLIALFAAHRREGNFEFISLQASLHTLALEGRWELWSDGDWTTIGEVRASESAQVYLALTRRAIGNSAPASLRFRFVPAEDLSRASLTSAGDGEALAVRPRGGGGFAQSSASGVLNETVEFECTLDRIMDVGDGTSWSGYVSKSSRFSGPEP